MIFEIPELKFIIENAKKGYNHYLSLQRLKNPCLQILFSNFKKEFLPFPALN